VPDKMIMSTKDRIAKVASRIQGEPWK